MKVRDMRVLLTGASGGIGGAIARRLLAGGAQVLLAGRDLAILHTLMQSLEFAGSRVQAHAADLTKGVDRTALCNVARRWQGGINVLINGAGQNPFAMYEDLTAEQIDATLAVNVQAPLHLCRELLPSLKSRESAIIVNIGSVFGAIGHPGYVAYSASKFAVRGFTEALRRELADTRIKVQYFAPRATRTAMNSAAAEEMNARLGVTMDPPERVARELVTLLEGSRRSAVVGWPEKLFVRINALLPGLVDRAMRGQLTLIRACTRPARTPPISAATPKEILSP
jgi:short-subunit dehydrogenase